jgi:rare lipoprotein A
MTVRQLAVLIALALTVAFLASWAWAGEVCGKASWYGQAHQGKTMANGQPFNMHAMTAAMWGVPFGAKFRVTRGDRSVVVTITDRGPARRLGRMIDLSQAAAAELGMLRVGVATVCIDRL